MAIYFPPSPTPENFAEAVKELLTPIATKMAGRDRRVTDNEAQNGVALRRVTVEESELASETVRRQIASSGAKRPSVHTTIEGIGRRALRAGNRARGGDNRISGDDAVARLPHDLRKIFQHLRTQGQARTTEPAGRDVVAVLQGATDGLSRWHESGDNGVDTRALHLNSAGSVDEALEALQQMVSISPAHVQPSQGRDAIDQFRTSAKDALEGWRATFYDGNTPPVRDENTVAMAAFDRALIAAFEPLSEVRLAHGDAGEMYLLGKVRDGYVVSVVWPYRDG